MVVGGSLVAGLIQGAAAYFVTYDDEPTRAVHFLIEGGTTTQPAYLVVFYDARFRMGGTASNFNSGIRSEREFRVVRWYAKDLATPDSFEIPFVRTVGCSQPCYIPVHIKISNPGTEAGGTNGFIDFATWTDPAWAGGAGIYPSPDNWTYKPSDVTHMCNYWITCPSNNSRYVVDRFWIIKPGNYSTNPTLSEVKFKYLDDEILVGGSQNIELDEVDFIAQRFNTSSQKWADWMPQVIVRNPTNNILKVGPVDPPNFFGSWTISDQDQPLPLRNVEYNARCMPGGINFVCNVNASDPFAYLEVLFSKDGKNFASAGTYPSGKCDIFIEMEGRGYIRVDIVGFDGSLLYSEVVPVECDALYDENDNVVIDDLGDNIFFTISGDGAYFAEIISPEGKVIMRKEGRVQGTTTFTFSKEGLSAGIYMARGHINATGAVRNFGVVK